MHTGAKYSGMLCDFGTLKKIVNDHIIDTLDHKNINDLDDTERPSYGRETGTDLWNFMKAVPTAENIIAWVVHVLLTIFEETLVRVRLYETPTSYVEWVPGEENESKNQ